MKKTSLLLFALLSVGLLLRTPMAVFADDSSQDCSTSTGSYGQTSTTCQTVEHNPVSAGVGDFSFWTVAEILTGAGIVLFGLAKVSEKIYWFD
jgi:hypothetical protein